MNFKLVNYCEIDKFASKSYSRLYDIDEKLNLNDITLINPNTIEDFDLLVGGSPCQSFSIAGKTEGAKYTCNDCNYEFNPLKIEYTKRKQCPKCNSLNLIGTKSSLIIDYLNILKEKNPKFAIFENVKNLINKKFYDSFLLFINEIESYGYNTYYKVLNAKNFGVPQNRERVFVVCIRKDLDNNKFKFPKEKKSIINLNHILVKNFNEKYLLKKELKTKLMKTLSEETLSKISYPICCSSRGRNKENPSSRISGLPTEQRLEINKQYITNTITTVGKDNYILDKYDDYILRRLLPIECFRLMGFRDLDFEKIKYYTDKEIESMDEKDILKLKKEIDILGESRYTYLSDSQVYQQTGNSIVVNVLIEIFKELFISMPYLFENLKVLSIFSGIGAFENALLRFDETQKKTLKVKFHYINKRILFKFIKKNKINSIGNASTNDSQAGKVYLTNGIFPTICAGCHGYALGYIIYKKERDKKWTYPY